ncbi:endonuclease/exonuclease/phosphatase family protein [Saccharothrix algeriensis]|uniref:Endonuclease/exonuclease/phosphatase (EEP) superfamily protein YafD n=1 Tax=Saccharothrix algeriensis TaxID=173560 RepID=A0ABS2S6F6_9PSEU|nr:endonuclease/exonuclease/phosphatase family protein [Saccharothrix algeriensis]MBM7811824.1 endonuclease/exonuclease/phosphatase (EEP) superfamily protein YafD [Saccharothrix algeriensis]
MVDIGERRPKSRPRNRATTSLLVLAATAFVVAAALRLLGVDGTRHMVAATALVPYFTVAGVLLGAVALLLRRWLVGAVTLVVALVLVATVAPRAFPDARPAGVGQQVRVMSANLLVGKAEAEALVDAVRDHEVDVLALQELTPAMVRDFERAGLDEVLPHRVFLAEPGGSGSGIASRHPLTPRTLAGPSTLRQAGALVDLPGEDLEVLSVHPLPPVVPDGPEHWQRDMAGLPGRDPGGPFRVLAGDFNATLDHVGLRRLLDQGYVDAADQVGAGLAATWPAGAVWPPPVVIDHVLVDDRCPVEAFQVVDVPGSDHRAIVTRFVVPAR